MGVMEEAGQASSYLKLLPAIYSEGGGFLGRFLLAFEQVFSGLPDGGSPPGLEHTIAGIARLFDPVRQAELLVSVGATPQARKDFLAWLSGWVALSLRADWEEDKQRAFLAQAAQLYRLRGTKEALTALLRTYTGYTARITEGDELPKDEKGRPHHFHVLLFMRAPQAELDRIGAIARGLIELQKPAHTTYVLEFQTPTMQIRTEVVGEDGTFTAQIGVDTTLTRFDNET